MTKLKQLRMTMGLSQMKLAVLTGIHPSTISRLERGVIPPYEGWARRIADALNIPPEDASKLFEQIDKT